jgi:hypothetical protein
MQGIGTGQLLPPHDNTNTNISKHRDKLGYANNSAHELHSTISNGLSKMEQQLTNLNHETNPTKNTTKLATLLKSIQKAYLTLAEITFQGETEGNTLGSFDAIGGNGSDAGNYEQKDGGEDGEKDDKEEENEKERDEKKKKSKKKKEKKDKTSANITFQGETEGNTLRSFDAISGDGSDAGNYEQKDGGEDGEKDDKEEEYKKERDEKKKKSKKKKEKKDKTSANITFQGETEGNTLGSFVTIDGDGSNAGNYE